MIGQKLRRREKKEKIYGEGKKREVLFCFSCLKSLLYEYLMNQGEQVILEKTQLINYTKIYVTLMGLLVQTAVK